MPVAQSADFDPAQRTPEVIIRSETHGKLLAMALMTWARTDGGHDVQRPAPRAAGRRLRVAQRPGRLGAHAAALRAPAAAELGRQPALHADGAAALCPARPADLRRDARLGLPPRGRRGAPRRRAAHRGTAPHRAVLGRRPAQDAHAGGSLGLDPHRPAARPQGEPGQRGRAVRAHEHGHVRRLRRHLEGQVRSSTCCGPVTYIQLAFDSNWVPPLMETPPFPEYPSGHSVQSGSAAAVLEAFYGRDTAFEDRAHNDRGWGPQALSRALPRPPIRPPSRGCMPASISAAPSNTAPRWAAASARRRWRLSRVARREARTYTEFMVSNLAPAESAGLTRHGDATVRHLRQVLLWPLRLLPRPRAADDQGPPWQHLRDMADRSPWREVVDEFTGDSAGFHERHYNEFVSFLPWCSAFCSARDAPAATANATTAARRCACSAATTSRAVRVTARPGDAPVRADDRARRPVLLLRHRRGACSTSRSVPTTCRWTSRRTCCTASAAPIRPAGMRRARRCTAWRRRVAGPRRHACWRSSDARDARRFLPIVAEHRAPRIAVALGLRARSRWWPTTPTTTRRSRTGRSSTTACR